MTRTLSSSLSAQAVDGDLTRITFGLHPHPLLEDLIEDLLDDDSLTLMSYLMHLFSLDEQDSGAVDDVMNSLRQIILD